MRYVCVGARVSVRVVTRLERSRASVTAGERFREQEVDENHADRPHIASLVVVVGLTIPVLIQLRCDVARRACKALGGRVVLLASHQAKVADFDMQMILACVRMCQMGDEDILGLQIPVDQRGARRVDAGDG